MPFRQRRYFYYLTGCNEPDCHVTYDVGKDELCLYVPESDVRKEVWFGAGVGVEEAMEK